MASGRRPGTSSPSTSTAIAATTDRLRAALRRRAVRATASSTTAVTFARHRRGEIRAGAVGQ